jgi:hypothetical protein
MRIELSEHKGTSLAEIISEEIVIHTLADALDLIGNCAYQGASKIIIHEKNLSPAFFDLKTGLAGDILQKFSNYRMDLAIVGDFSRYTSKSLRDFIYESNQGSRVNFVRTVAEAKE